MKMFIRTFLLLSIVFLTGGAAFSQSSNVVSHFKAKDSKGQVLLHWTVAQGSNCEGIQVLRSVDGNNYQPIGEIYGVCGNPYGPTEYTFVDLSPAAGQINYYKLALGKDAQAPGYYTYVLESKPKRYVVRSRPVQASTTNIRFDNPTGERYELRILDMNGKALRYITTNGTTFNVDAANLGPGAYRFQIGKEGGSPRMEGRFVVADE